MKKNFMNIFSLLAIVIMGLNSSQAAKKCGSDQYYNQQTKRCDVPSILIGYGDQLKSLTLKQLVAKYGLTQLEVLQNPAYSKMGTVKTPRVYKGIDLKKLLEDLLPTERRLEDHVVAVTCLDGFDPVLSSEMILQLNKQKSLLASQQIFSKNYKGAKTQDELWEPVDVAWMGGLNPGPFYLVWEKPEGTYWQGWPFQVKSLQLIDKKTYSLRVDKITPPKKFLGNDPKSSVETGFGLFKGLCMTCHKANGFGGNKSQIDLAAYVKGFKTKTAAKNRLIEVISNPPAGMQEIRASKLSDEQIAAVTDYLYSLVPNK